MKTFDVSIPEVAFVAGTRGMAGVGVGLLLADCFKDADSRKAIGWTLLALGALTTIPIALTVLARREGRTVGELMHMTDASPSGD